MQKDIDRIIIESMVKRAMESAEESPERSVRNLIDLGVNFAKGRFQKKFLGTAQEMMQNQDSAYYHLFEDAMVNVDHDILLTFGINLGYNGCTKGARKIREIEVKKGYNIPWSLSIQMGKDKLEKEPEFYSGLFRQGMTLGVYVYFLFLSEGDPEKLIPFFANRPECAFVVFTRNMKLSTSFIRAAKKCRNVMVSVYLDENGAENCMRLRKDKMLYGTHTVYCDKDREEILNGKWLEKILPLHPQFAFLLPDDNCENHLQEEVYRYVLSVRTRQKYPVCCMEVRKDCLQIDEVVSEDACVVGFDKRGAVKTYSGSSQREEENIFRHGLEEVLEKVATKKKNRLGSLQC